MTLAEVFGVVVLSMFVAFCIGWTIGYSSGETDGRIYGLNAKAASVRFMVQKSHELRDQRDEYRDMATEMCDRMQDCMYCHLEPEKHDERCRLWQLNDKTGWRASNDD